MRRGSSLSMNTIIIAAIGLVVLIVLIVIFTGRTKVFMTGTKSCESKSGNCMRLIECKDIDGAVYRNTDCDDNNPESLQDQLFNDNYEVCCVKVI